MSHTLIVGRGTTNWLGKRHHQQARERHYKPTLEKQQPTLDKNRNKRHHRLEEKGITSRFGRQALQTAIGTALQTNPAVATANFPGRLRGTSLHSDWGVALQTDLRRGSYKQILGRGTASQPRESSRRHCNLWGEAQQNPRKRQCKLTLRWGTTNWLWEEAVLTESGDRHYKLTLGRSSTDGLWGQAIRTDSEESQYKPFMGS